MAKTKEELNIMKKELESLATKLQELDDEEIEDIVGGGLNYYVNKKNINFDLIRGPGSRPDIRKELVGAILRNVFVDKSLTSTFKDKDIKEVKNEFVFDSNDTSVFK